MSCAVNLNETEFSVVPSLPFLEINRAGVVRFVDTKEELKHKRQQHCNLSYSVFVRFTCPQSGKTRCKTINVMLHETFGDGAATAAGFNEPKKPAKKPKNRDGVKKPKALKENQRLCHDCKKVTYSFRCEKCWAILRAKYNG